MALVSVPFAAWLQEHFLHELYPLWKKHAVLPGGMAAPVLDRQWKRKEPVTTTLLSQGRVMCFFLLAESISPQKGNRELIESMFAFADRHLKDPVNGGFFWCCREDGTVTERAKHSTGHCILLTAAALAYKLFRDPGYLSLAGELFELITTRFRDRHQGLTGKTSENWKPYDENRSQYPLMLWFEYLLQLHDIPEIQTGDEKPAGFTKDLILKEAIQTVEHLFFRREDSGFNLLPEVYSTHWVPLGIAGGGYYSIGHQFAWSWMLSRGVEAGMPASFQSVAGDLLHSALCFGYNDATGRIHSRIDELGNVLGTELAPVNGLYAARSLR